MITITLTGYPTGATNLYAYYAGRTLANYVADKVLFVEGTGADIGLYTAIVDETKGTQIVAFVGATQPTDWSEQLVGVGWDLTSQIAATQATAIKAKTDLIGTTGATITVPVLAGAITGPLVIGDNYLSSLDNAFEFIFTPPSSAVIGSSTVFFGWKGVSVSDSMEVEGSLEDVGDGTWKAIFEITNIDSASIAADFYNWSVLFCNGTDNKTIARGTRVKWVQRQTVSSC